MRRARREHHRSCASSIQNLSNRIWALRSATPLQRSRSLEWELEKYSSMFTIVGIQMKLSDMCCLIVVRSQDADGGVAVEVVSYLYVPSPGARGVVLRGELSPLGM